MNVQDPHGRADDTPKAWAPPRLETLGVAMTRSGVVEGRENTGAKSINTPS
jgi:hypothetical protein